MARLALALLLLLPLCAALEPAAELRENHTPDFGHVNASWARASNGSAALTLTFGAEMLGTLPQGMGRTALTLLADPIELPQVCVFVFCCDATS